MGRELPPIGRVVIAKCRIKYGRLVHTLAAKRVKNFRDETDKWIYIPEGEYSDYTREISDVFSWRDIE